MSIVSLLDFVSIFKKIKKENHSNHPMQKKFYWGTKYPCENSLNLFLKLKMSGNE